jgi:hypothetical protein
MGRMQRNKGARGELEAAEMLRKHLGIAAERAARNGVDGASDLDTSMTFWKWEVKRYARLGVESIMQRAELDQASSAIRLDHTALLMRADDCEWLIVLRLHDVPQFLRDLEIQRLRDPLWAYPASGIRCCHPSPSRRAKGVGRPGTGSRRSCDVLEASTHASSARPSLTTSRRTTRSEWWTTLRRSSIPPTWRFYAPIVTRRPIAAQKRGFNERKTPKTAFLG